MGRGLSLWFVGIRLYKIINPSPPPLLASRALFWKKKQIIFLSIRGYFRFRLAQAAGWEWDEILFLRFEPSSVKIRERYLGGYSGTVEVVQSVKFLHRSWGQAVTVTEEARTWSYTGGTSLVRGGRCSWTTDAASGPVSLLTHHVPSPFRPGVLEPYLNIVSLFMKIIL